MTRLIIAVVLLGSVTVPALACDWNKSVQTQSRSTYASQTQLSKPTHQQNGS